jgi:hypothetical protein
LDPKDIQTFYGKKNFKNLRDFVKVEDWGVHCKKYNGPCTKPRVKIPKATWTSPIIGRKSTCRTSSYMAFLWRMMWKLRCPMEPPRVNSFGWGVKVWWQGRRWPCNAFIRLDGKTYCMKFSLEMFIGRWYNWRGTYDVSVICKSMEVDKRGND